MWPGPFDRAYPAENVAPLVSSQTSRTIKPYFSFNMLNAIFFIPGNENFDQFIGFFRNWFCLIFNLLLFIVQKRMDITDSGGSMVSWSLVYKPSNQAWNMIYLMITCRLPLHETPGLFFLLERANLHQLEGGIGRDYSVSIIQPLSLSLSLFVGIFVAL